MYSILPEAKNPALRLMAVDVRKDEIMGERIQNLIREMSALLRREKYGVALAAPQVGEAIRLFIVSGRALARGARNAPDEEDAQESGESGENIPDQVYINPQLLKISKKKSDKHEGCLSIRGKWGMVPRAEKATVKALDEKGKPFTRGAAGFLAHIFQHELDHLSGVLYTDKATEIFDEDEGEDQHEGGD